MHGSDSIDVLGTRVHSVNMRQAVQRIEGWIREKTPAYVTCTGMHGVMESRQDDEVRRIHNDASLVVPDGMPLVWLNRYYGHKHVSRVYGPDLMLAVCSRGVHANPGFRHFFYGGAPGVPEALAAAMKDRFPGIRIAGGYSPPYRTLTAEEDAAVVQMIRDSEADIVWIGLSTPKQERWMAEHLDRLGSTVMIGVGAAFDFHTGRLTQAPRWMQSAGLEWLFRLLAEPGRLWKRYLKNVPLFLLLTLRQMVTTRDRRRTESSRRRSSSGS